MNEAMTSNQPPVVNQNPVSTFIQIYTNPEQAYQAISKKPDWLIPVIFMILLALITIFLTSEIAVKEQIAYINNSEMIPEERKAEIIDEMENPSAARKYLMPMVGGALGIFLVYAVVAGAFLVVGNFILGGQTSFKENMALYAWGSMIGVLELLVKVPLMLSKGSMKVYTSLALLMENAEPTGWLFRLADATDIFTIWKIVVLAIGFSVINKFSKGKSYAAVIGLFVVYLGLSILFGQLFSGFMS